MDLVSYPAWAEGLVNMHKAKIEYEVVLRNSEHNAKLNYIFCDS